VIYYKRKSSVDSFSLYDNMVKEWEKTNNVLGTDFDLYSTYNDLLSDTNKWTYCTYGGGVGSFRHCGPDGYAGGNWYVADGHYYSNHNAFKANDKELSWSILDTPTGV
jgi:hypothetical protein